MRFVYALDCQGKQRLSDCVSAIGAREVQPNSTMTTVDHVQAHLHRGEPLSGTKFGGADDNRLIVEENSSRAELGNVITLDVGTSITCAASANVLGCI